MHIILGIHSLILLGIISHVFNIKKYHAALTIFCMVLGSFMFHGESTDKTISYTDFDSDPHFSFHICNCTNTKFTKVETQHIQ